MPASLRHRTSLEGVLFSHQGLPPETLAIALKLFDRIMKEFEPSQTSSKIYKPITLIRLTKQGVFLTDNFLILFFAFLGSERLGAESSLAEILADLQVFEQWTSNERHELSQSLENLARYLIDNFFLLLKASAAKTPQLTPASVLHLKESEEAIGTPQRLSKLRETCLARDRHRCVISRNFDIREARKRYKINGEDIRDDDWNPLMPEIKNMSSLEVAHIIPHSLMSHSVIDGESKLNNRKRIAHKILEMFNPGAVHLISGTGIDREMNALTLTHELHQLFGDFEIAFEPVQGQKHTYKIDYITTNSSFRTQDLPVTRTLYITADRSLDPPSSQLLELHRVIGHILHLSAAGEYLDKFLEDMRDIEEGQVVSNGSTRIDDYVRYKLACDFYEVIVF